MKYNLTFFWGVILILTYAPTLSAQENNFKKVNKLLIGKWLIDGKNGYDIKKDGEFSIIESDKIIKTAIWKLSKDALVLSILENGEVKEEMKIGFIDKYQFSILANFRGIEEEVVFGRATQDLTIEKYKDLIIGTWVWETHNNNPSLIFYKNWTVNDSRFNNPDSLYWDIVIRKDEKYIETYTQQNGEKMENAMLQILNLGNQRLVISANFSVGGAIPIVFKKNATLADGVTFIKGSWEDAVAAAKKANKLLFVRGYTDQCGSCIMMAKDVFPDAKVGAFMNANFVCYQMNVVDGSNQEASEIFFKYGGRFTPGLIFVDPKDESMVYASSAGKGIDDFIQIAQSALDMPANKAKYQSGNMSQEEKISFWMDTYSMLDNPMAKDVATYLASQPENELSKKANYYLMMYYIKSPDSREFKYYISHADEFISKYKEKAVTFLDNVLNAIYSIGLEKNDKQMILNFADNYAKFKSVLPADFIIENFKKELKEDLDQQLGK